MGLIKTRGNGEIVGLSLSELLMLVSFIFLVVLALFARDLHRAVQANNDAQALSRRVAEAARQAEVLDELLFRNDAAPMPDSVPGPLKDATKVVALLERVETAVTWPAAAEVLEEYELPEVWNALREAQGGLARAEALLEQFRSGKEETEILQARIEELEMMQEALERENEELQQARAEHRERLAAVAGQLAQAGAGSVGELVKELEVKEGRLANLAKRAGVGDPPCWTTPDGGFEFLYTIRIRDDGFVIDKAWPEYREAELGAIDAPDLRYPSRRIGPDEFQAMMLPLWNYGRRNDSCRFFVRVVDQTSPVSKEAWQQNLQLVENYFYKSVVRR